MKYKYYYIITIIFFFTNFIIAQDGVLDPTFGTGGTVMTHIGPTHDWAESVAIQSDGKIVVVGYSRDDISNRYFTLVRYNSDGSLDTGFGSGGKVTTSVGVGLQDEAYSVAIQSDGKIVVTGHSTISANFVTALVRYNSNGSLDASFGSGGKVTTLIGSLHSYGNGLAIQSDGKIVVAGSSSDGSTSEFALARYNSNGSLDAGFGSGGKVNSSFGPFGGWGTSLAIQSDGKIVVAGVSYDGSQYDFALARYNINGSLDAGFGSNGKVITPIGLNDDRIFSVAIQSDGKIVVAGESHNGTNYDFSLARYNSNGSLDVGFGINGKLITPVGLTFDVGYGVAIQSDGKIVVAGYSISNVGSQQNFAIVRYNSSGSLDASFGSSGIASTLIGSEFAEGTCLAIQSDGKIVVAGRSYDGSTGVFAVARYNNPSLLNTDVDEIDYNIPKELELNQNYPNPFNPATTIKFNLPTDSNVRLNVFNVLGEEVAELINNNMQAGFHSVEFDASGLNSGIYFYKIEAGGFSQVRKMMLLK
jgi:uncharacterized delta-60 repeat protein